MRYTRIYATPDGESHFEDVDVPMAPLALGPGIPPVDLSRPVAATGVFFMHAPADRPGALDDVGPHAAPRRMFVLYLAGEAEHETSDGDVRRVGPGSVLLAEDTTGKGHRTRNFPGEQIIAFVPLAEGG